MWSPRFYIVILCLFAVALPVSFFHSLFLIYSIPSDLGQRANPMSPKNLRTLGGFKSQILGFRGSIGTPQNSFFLLSQTLDHL